jgi:general secretion pathway protein E
MIDRFQSFRQLFTGRTVAPAKPAARAAGKSASARPASSASAERPKTVGAKRPASAPAAAAAAPRKPAEVSRTPRPLPQAPVQPVRTQVRPQQGTALVPASVGGSTFAPAGEEDLHLLLNYTGEVATAPGGRYEISDGSRQFVVVLGNNYLLVANGSYTSPEVSAARSLLSKQGFVPVKSLIVDLTLINEIYRRNDGSAHAERTAARTDQTKTQRIIYDLIQAAFAEKCTDIRIRVELEDADISVRRQGAYVKLRSTSPMTGHSICRAAFFAADVADANYIAHEHQGARINGAKFKLPEGLGSIRMQFAPLTNGGRLLAMRLLPVSRDEAQIDVDVLGYSQHQIGQIKRMRRRSAGVIVTCGPTGSGKSTTLKVNLEQIYYSTAGELNIISVEDPPEYRIRGVSQMPVANADSDEQRREAFRKAIASALRLDPDVIMIGEIRDGASARLAFEAAMSGHLVLTTVHSNDALSIIDRLRDQGVEHYKLSDHTLMVGLIGQRLIRNLCNHCKIPIMSCEDAAYDNQKEMLRTLVGEAFWDDIYVAKPAEKDSPRACQHCKGMGYTGRAVVAETILPDETFMGLISRSADPSAVALSDGIATLPKVLARNYWLDNLEGMMMVEHGFAKVMLGEADPRDIELKVGLIDEIRPERVPRIFAMMCVPGAEKLPNQALLQAAKANALGFAGDADGGDLALLVSGVAKERAQHENR